MTDWPVVIPTGQPVGKPPNSFEEAASPCIEELARRTFGDRLARPPGRFDSQSIEIKVIEQQPSGNAMPRTELASGAWFDYAHDFLSAALADRFLCALLERDSWSQLPIVVFGKEVMQPRLMDWCGDVPYRYSGLTMEPRAYDPVVAELKDLVERAAGVEFNHVLLNLYRDGMDTVAMHADNEPELGRDPIIASISLGATRRFVLQAKDRRKTKRHMRLVHGSLLVMGGTMQHTWRHALPRDQSVREPRVNVTFRRLMGPPGWRGDPNREPKEA